MLYLQEEVLHSPVLLSELLSLFSKEDSPQQILDCTFGRGGHSLAFLREFPKVKITGLDCDDQAIKYGSSLEDVKRGKIRLLQENFHDFPSVADKKEFYDTVLMDLGVSSPQLDEAARGFSFSQNGPLDMRMDRGQKFKADDIINSWSKEELIALFQYYGEIKNPYRVVSAILRRREKKKIKSTLELSNLIQRHWPRRSRYKHPATLWFLALRMEVNQELEGLKSCLPDFLPLLKKQGFFIVISFHSLEDRIVKRAFQKFVSEGKGCLWNKKVICSGFEEKKQNPRSRSAKMRVFQKQI